MKGIVMGGQQPVGGSSLQLYAAGTTGYGSAATPMFTGTLPATDASGGFSLPAYTCPAPGSQMYLVATGGQPIAATSTTAAVSNPNLALMAALGSCSSLSNSTFVNMNEITTVAAVWALSPFMTGIANIGSSSTNALGIANAFAAVNKVSNTAAGTIPGLTLPVGAAIPTNKINTLADILEQCINSGGGSASDTTDGQSNGTGCGKLFYLAGGASTTDTITAAMVIAHNPSANTAKLNQLRSAQPVFMPVLSVNTPPSDWSIVITYTGGGLTSPQAIAADQSGNIWVANAGSGSNTGSVSEFNSVGAAISPAGGFTAGGINVPYSLAVDQSGNVWVANSGNNTVTQLAPSGTTGTVYSNNGLNVPRGIAIDATGNVFVANSGGSTVSGFTSAGAALTGSPYSGAGIASPVAIAINPK